MLLNEAEQLLVLKMAEELTGASQTVEKRTGSIFSNVERRMRECECETFAEYIHRVDTDPAEKNNLISALTIHTTAWFRENPHFVKFHEILLEAVDRRETFKVWCAACSTGEEVYSFAIVLEEFRSTHPRFDYRIYGSDIDPVSIETAERGVYSAKQINFSLDRYKHHLLFGTGKTAEFFTLSKEIRTRCSFAAHDLRSKARQSNGPFDVVVCRNVLIYFSADGVKQVMNGLISNLKREGTLFLGHSESVAANDFGITSCGHSVYTVGIGRPTEKIKPSADRTDIGQSRPPLAGIPTSGASAGPKTGSFRIEAGPHTGMFSIAKVKSAKPTILAVDDTKTSRQLLAKVFGEFGFDCEAVETTTEATQLLKVKSFDLITLDLQMPGMEGGAWLLTERAKGLKAPVVIVSEIRREDAANVVNLLGKTAQDYIEKSDLLQKSSEVRDTFLEILRSQSGAKSSAGVRSVTNLKEKPSFRPDVILVGASTGGPQALAKLLTRLPHDCPPVVVVQHISGKFSAALADRLSTVSGLTLAKMEDGENLQKGHLYIALDDYHIGVEEDRRGLRLKLSTDLPVNRHRPSVDYLFRSVANTDRSPMAILLTGMGRDGAVGLKGLRERGAYCVAQSEEDCIVFGMPREAINIGAAQFAGNIDDIRANLLASLTLNPKVKAS
ncbi:MAG: response regulator [Deltaproteobacteria bacterium]|nr:response regulator [Deltaproteobacteria bacterium]